MPEDRIRGLVRFLPHNLVARLLRANGTTRKLFEINFFGRESIASGNHRFPVSDDVLQLDK
jgi:hypothetical protein